MLLGGGVDTFEVVVSDCGNQVNVFLLTPEPGQSARPLRQTGVVEDMWTVATEARCNELRGGIPSAYPAADPEDIAGVAGVKLLRLWGY